MKPLLRFRRSISDFLLRASTAVMLVIGLSLILVAAPRSYPTYFGVIALSLGTFLFLLLYYRNLKHLRTVEDKFDYPFVVLESLVTITLLDVEGKRANYSKDQKCLVMKESLHGYTERSLYSDGQIEDLKTGENTAYFLRDTSDSECKKLSLDVVFKDPPRKHSIVEKRLSCTMINGFKYNKEYFRIFYTLPVLEQKIVIRFPLARPPKQTWYIRSGSIGSRSEENTPVPKIEKSEDGSTCIVMIERNPELGSETTTWWEW